MIHHAALQNRVKVRRSIQKKETMAENVQLAADMKHNESKKIVDSRVTREDEEGGNRNHDIRQFVLRGLRYVVHIMGLYGHRSTRIGNIRQVSRGDSKNWQNDNKDVCQPHKKIRDRGDYSRGFGSSHHHFSLFWILKPYPILRHHAYYRCGSFEGKIFNA